MVIIILTHTSPNQTRNQRGIALAALIIVGGGVLLGVLLLRNRPAATPGLGTQVNIPGATISGGNVNLPNAITIDPNATQLVEVGAAYCVALVPDGWSFASEAPYTGADIFSPDKRIHAAWSITALKNALYPTDESALNGLMNAVYPGFTLTSPKKDLGIGFITREFSTGSGQKGQLFYIYYGFDPNNSVIPIYFAATDADLWTTQGGSGHIFCHLDPLCHSCARRRQAWTSGRRTLPIQTPTRM